MLVLLFYLECIVLSISKVRSIHIRIWILLIDSTTPSQPVSSYPSPFNSTQSCSNLSLEHFFPFHSFVQFHCFFHSYSASIQFQFDLSLNANKWKGRERDQNTPLILANEYLLLFFSIRIANYNRIQKIEGGKKISRLNFYFGYWLKQQPPPYLSPF